MVLSHFMFFSVFLLIVPPSRVSSGCPSSLVDAGCDHGALEERGMADSHCEGCVLSELCLNCRMRGQWEERSQC